VAASTSTVRRLLAVCGPVRTPGLATRRSLLTAREHEVASMAAAGLTNRQIAGRLGVSVRTVGNQLQRVYEKLGVSSRLDLPDALAGRPDDRD
jgi:DNA-binding CsgD family transcriptional regulator